MSVFLETERLTLRRFSEDDVDNLHELDSDPEVTRFLTGGRPTSREDLRDRILPAILDDYERFGGFETWAAIEKSGGEFIGWFELRPENCDPPDNVELGYRLRRSAWGRGYATESSKALIERGFTEVGARRVFARTMTVNKASRRVLEKCGLVFVKTFHEEWPYYIDGAEFGDVEYELLRDEWIRRGAG